MSIGQMFFVMEVQRHRTSKVLALNDIYRICKNKLSTFVVMPIIDCETIGAKLFRFISILKLNGLNMSADVKFQVCL